MDFTALHQAVMVAEEVFSFSLPITLEELKTTFRALSRKYHPDTGGSTADAQKFARVKEGYDFLASFEGLPEVFSASDVSSGEKFTLANFKTVDGTLLSELGKGLSYPKNGRECDQCNHRGYTSQREQIFTSCSACHSHGRIRRVVGGRPYYAPCRACSGRGGVYQEKAHMVHHRCLRCHGTGEIELFNVVLPKGRVA